MSEDSSDKPTVGTIRDIQVGTCVFLQYKTDRNEIPENIFNRKDIEPVIVKALPTRSESRFYVYSVWRDLYFFESGDRIMTTNPFDLIKSA